MITKETYNKLKNIVEEFEKLELISKKYKLDHFLISV